MIDYRIKIRPKGALFNGQALRAQRDYFEAAKQGIAEEGVIMVRDDYDRHHRNPSGYAWSQVSMSSEPDPVVWDGGIIYGPWLEGVSSRNKTTRFKGYRTYRRMSQELNRRATRIAESILPPFLARMRGR